MRLRRLELTNFRGFEQRGIDFHPQFNVLIGENGVGKTSILEATAVALGGWLQAFPRTDQRHIRLRDIRRVEQIIGSRARSLLQFPVTVQVVGEFELDVDGYAEPRTLAWSRSLANEGSRTSNAGTRELRVVARSVAGAVRSGSSVTLPVVRYFGAGRLWEAVRSSETRRAKRLQKSQMADAERRPSENSQLDNPFYGYRMSVDKRANTADLIRWMGEERRNEIDLEQDSVALLTVYGAIRSMLPELSNIRYELRRSKMILEYQNGSSANFEDLSDGYRNVVALAADLAIKMTMLNPHLGRSALKETPGVVLIDEIDLHLHPRWQRRVCEDLRRTFPRVQFICTTHSPFIVQSLRSGEELVVLDGQPTAETANLTLEEVAEGLMGVDDAATSQRYSDMKNTARALLEDMDRRNLCDIERFHEFRRHMAESVAPYADNPAYQAYLEMKLSAKAPPELK